MVCLDIDHPEVESFVGWKVEEEKKVAALIAAGYDSDFNGEAYQTVSGQNSNNSVCTPDTFLDALKANGDWHLFGRVEMAQAQKENRPPKPFKTVRAVDLWNKIANAAWACADPGLLYTTTMNDWHTCPKGGPIKSTNPCVTGDTLVATREGWKRIDSLLNASFELLCHDGHFRTVEAAFKTGVKPVYKLRTRSGYEVKLTADHKVLTLNRGDVPACELTKDDVLELMQQGKSGTEEIDLGMSVFLGLMLGDGCLIGERGHEQALLTLAPTEEHVALAAKSILDWYRAEAAIDGRGNREINVNAPQGTLRVGTASRCVVELLQKYAVLNAGSLKKRLTDAAFGLSRGCQAALLRGLFTADGTVANYGGKSHYVGLDSSSLELLQQVQVLLLNFGVKAKIYTNRRPLGQTMALLPDGKGGSKEYPIEPQHSLRISRSSRFQFADAIGFMAESSKSLLLRRLNATVSAYKDDFTDNVESLEFIGEQPVFDLTEPMTHHFVANGITVHNCGEYQFLDDTACNLASLNLMKFLKPDGSFDVAAFRHAVNIWTVVLEISVLMAQYPSAEIAQRSYDYRTIGLGYANLGTLLMCMGLPYDSEKGRAVAAAVTAVMTGTAYRASAEMAAAVGHFPKYPENSTDMMRVMRNHRRAAYNAIPEDYQGLHTIPQGLKPEHCPESLYKAACEAWDEAVTLGQKHGFRNAQATVIAPTGTIGLLMDCDTTGIEPDFAVVKFKKLAGGGSFKIVNQSVSLALRTLGYSDVEIRRIVAHIAGTNTFANAPHVDTEALLAKGFTLEDIAKIENDLPRSSHLSSAFAPRRLGAVVLKRIGVTEGKVERLLDKNSEEQLDVLEYLGFSKAQIAEADAYICGKQTIEGAAGLKPEHLAVFDCASRCGETGTRCIHYSGHIKMLGAVQPFVSGGISKTINMPMESTVDDIKRVYFESHRLGVKAVALYRDGCKLSQVMTTGGLNGKAGVSKPLDLNSMTPEELFKAIPAEKRVRKLPKKRRGLTYELKVGGHKIYLRTGEYANGDLGEIFLDVSKEGSTLRNILSCFAVAISKGLQHSVPLRTFVDTFTLTKFDPAGVVEGHSNIKQATSIIDAVFRVLANDYLNDDELSQVKLGNSGGPVIAALPVPIENDDTQMVRTIKKESLQKKSVEATPLCYVCGGLTIRTGTCHVCSSCGTSQGCS